MAEYLVKKETLDKIANQALAMSGKSGPITLSEVIDDLSSINSEIRTHADKMDDIIRFLYKQNPSAMLIAIVERSATLVSDDNIELIGDHVFYTYTSLITANFPSATSIGDEAFGLCTELTTANFPSATSIGKSAFSVCGKLTTANFPSATSIGDEAFRNCYSLTTANFPSATSIGSNAFYGCRSLTTANFPSATSTGDYAFGSCIKLTTANFPSATSIGKSAFNMCNKLTTANFPSATSIGSNAFYGCASLTTVILRNTEQVCTLSSTSAFRDCYHFHGTKNSTYNPDGLKDGYIYVPAALLESYKKATNWSTLASQFRAIEEYPDICGGE